MLTRRHIRVKVMQSVYAYRHNETPSLDVQEKFFWHSINQMQDLYLLMLQSLVALREHAEKYLQKSQKKHLATAEEKNPSRAFVDNKLLLLLKNSESLQQAIKNKKLDYWKEDDEYISILFNELRESDFYQDYLKQHDTTYKEDRDFIIKVYKEVIAPNEKLYEYLEDKRLTWLDDFPLVNTSLVKIISKTSARNIESHLVNDLYKNEEDREFAQTLLRKVILNDEKLTKEIEGKTPNWDKERIADIDLIILKMGISEFLFFPSIPVRASINEYLEISKEYSTPKSSIFINGILDKLVKEYTASNKLNKIGRGLR